MCYAGKEEYLLFDLFKAFDLIESSQKSYFIFSKQTYLPSCSKLGKPGH